MYIGPYEHWGNTVYHIVVSAVVTNTTSVTWQRYTPATGHMILDTNDCQCAQQQHMRHIVAYLLVLLLQLAWLKVIDDDACRIHECSVVLGC